MERDPIGSVHHGSTGNTTAQTSRPKGKSSNAIREYLKELKANAEPHATLFVRNCGGATTLKHDNPDLLQLPSYMTKRKIYEKFCYLRGWKAVVKKKKSYGPLKDYEKVDNLEQYTICSWQAFNGIWNTDFPGMCIRNPSADICCECFILKNKFRYRAEKNYVKGYQQKMWMQIETSLTMQSSMF